MPPVRSRTTQKQVHHFSVSFKARCLAFVGHRGTTTGVLLQQSPQISLFVLLLALCRNDLARDVFAANLLRYLDISSPISSTTTNTMLLPLPYLTHQCPLLFSAYSSKAVFCLFVTFERGFGAAAQRSRACQTSTPPGRL